jgi:hypothetical protein
MMNSLTLRNGYVNVTWSFEATTMNSWTLRNVYVNVTSSFEATTMISKKCLCKCYIEFLEQQQL